MTWQRAFWLAGAMVAAGIALIGSGDFGMGAAACAYALVLLSWGLVEGGEP